MLPLLEDLPLWQRIAIAIAVVLIGLLLAAALHMTAEAEQQSRFSPTDIPISKYEERLLALDREAIEQAYKDHIKNVFAVWMRDDRGQPGRALTGAQQGHKAFVGSMEGIERREQQVKQFRDEQGK
jgi:hypothetical protein